MWIEENLGRENSKRPSYIENVGGLYKNSNVFFQHDFHGGV